MSKQNGAQGKAAKKSKQDSNLNSSEAAAEIEYTRNFSHERLKVRWLVRHTYFSGMVYVVILINTVLIAADDIYATRNNNHWVVAVSVYADWAILGIFTMEMLLKMYGLGLGYKPPLEDDVDPELAGYFAGPWNRLDSFVVLMSWVMVPIAALSGADVEKLVRVLRLTRYLTSNPYQPISTHTNPHQSIANPFTTHTRPIPNPYQPTYQPIPDPYPTQPTTSPYTNPYRP